MSNTRIVGEEEAVASPQNAIIIVMDDATGQTQEIDAATMQHLISSNPGAVNIVSIDQDTLHTNGAGTGTSAHDHLHAHESDLIMDPDTLDRLESALSSDEAREIFGDGLQIPGDVSIAADDDFPEELISIETDDTPDQSGDGIKSGRNRGGRTKKRAAGTRRSQRAAEQSLRDLAEQIRAENISKERQQQQQRQQQGSNTGRGRGGRGRGRGRGGRGGQQANSSLRSPSPDATGVRARGVAGQRSFVPDPGSGSRSGGSSAEDSDDEPLAVLVQQKAAVSAPSDLNTSLSDADAGPARPRRDRKVPAKLLDESGTPQTNARRGGVKVLVKGLDVQPARRGRQENDAALHGLDVQPARRGRQENDAALQGLDVQPARRGRQENDEDDWAGAYEEPHEGEDEEQEEDEAEQEEEEQEEGGTREDEEGEDEESDTWQSEDDPEKLWCICRQPHNNRFMICCDKCEDWFHGSCVGVTRAMGAEMEETGTDWVCPLCRRKTKQREAAEHETRQREVAERQRSSLARQQAREAGAAPRRRAVRRSEPTLCAAPRCENLSRPGSDFCSELCGHRHAQRKQQLLSGSQQQSLAQKRQQKSALPAGQKSAGPVARRWGVPAQKAAAPAGQKVAAAAPAGQKVAAAAPAGQKVAAAAPAGQKVAAAAPAGQKVAAAAPAGQKVAAAAPAGQKVAAAAPAGQKVAPQKSPSLPLVQMMQKARPPLQIQTRTPAVPQPTPKPAKGPKDFQKMLDAGDGQTMSIHFVDTPVANPATSIVNLPSQIASKLVTSTKSDTTSADMPEPAKTTAAAVKPEAAAAAAVRPAAATTPTVKLAAAAAPTVKPAAAAAPTVKPAAAADSCSAAKVQLKPAPAGRPASAAVPASSTAAKHAVSRTLTVAAPESAEEAPPTAAAPAAAAGPLKSSLPPDARVIVFERQTGNLLTGPKAPTVANLKSWLQEHPTFQVLKPGMPLPVSKFYGKSASVASGATKTAQIQVIRPGGTTKFTIGSAGPAGSKSDSAVRKVTVLTGTGALRPQADEAGHYSPTRKPSTDSQQRKPSSGASPAQARYRRRSSDYAPDEVDDDFRDEKKKRKKKQKEPEPEPKDKRVVDTDRLRANVKKTLCDVLHSRCKGDKEKTVKMEVGRIRELVEEIEEQLFALHRDVNFKYKAKYRSFIFNLKDTKNKGLYRKVLLREIEPTRLVTMTADELASRELAEWREREEKKELEAIEKHEMDMISLGNKFVMKTHKGEQVIEKDDDLKLIEEKSKGGDEELLSPVDEEPAASISSSGLSLNMLGDQTSQHGQHVYDLACLICTGKMPAPPPPPPPPPPRKKENPSKSSSSKSSKKTTIRWSDEEKSSPSSSSKSKSRHQDRGERKSSSSSQRGDRHHQSSSRPRSSNSSGSSSRPRSSNSSGSSSRTHSSSNSSRHRDRVRDKRREGASRDRHGRDKYRDRDGDDRRDRDNQRRHSNERESNRSTASKGKKEGAKSPQSHTPGIGSRERERPQRAHSQEKEAKSPSGEKDWRGGEEEAEEPRKRHPSREVRDMERRKRRKSLAEGEVARGDTTPADRDKEISSTVTIKTPPHAHADQSADPVPAKQKPARSVWRGFISMPDICKFFTQAFEVSGNSSHLATDVPDRVEVVGRIAPQTIWGYIRQVKKSNKEVVVVRLQPATDEEKLHYASLYSYLSKKSRIGVLGGFSKVIKDFYIMPLASTDPVPSVLLPFSGPGLDDLRQHMLLGLILYASGSRKRKHDSSSRPEVEKRGRPVSPPDVEKRPTKPLTIGYQPERSAYQPGHYIRDISAPVSPQAPAPPTLASKSPSPPKYSGPSTSAPAVSETAPYAPPTFNFYQPAKRLSESEPDTDTEPELQVVEDPDPELAIDEHRNPEEEVIPGLGGGNAGVIPGIGGDYEPAFSTMPPFLEGASSSLEKEDEEAYDPAVPTASLDDEDENVELALQKDVKDDEEPYDPGQALSDGDDDNEAYDPGAATPPLGGGEAAASDPAWLLAELNRRIAQQKTEIRQAMANKAEMDDAEAPYDPADPPDVMATLRSRAEELSRLSDPIIANFGDHEDDDDDDDMAPSVATHEKALQLASEQPPAQEKAGPEPPKPAEEACAAPAAPSRPSDPRSARQKGNLASLTDSDLIAKAQAQLAELDPRLPPVPPPPPPPPPPVSAGPYGVRPPAFPQMAAARPPAPFWGDHRGMRYGMPQAQHPGLRGLPAGMFQPPPPPRDRADPRRRRL